MKRTVIEARNREKIWPAKLFLAGQKNLAHHFLTAKMVRSRIFVEIKVFMICTFKSYFSCPGT